MDQRIWPIWREDALRVSQTAVPRGRFKRGRGLPGTTANSFVTANMVVAT
jgi:hypothetical protein